MKRVQIPKKYVEQFNDQYFENAVELAITVADGVEVNEQLFQDALQAIHDAMQEERNNPPMSGKKPQTL